MKYYVKSSDGREWGDYSTRKAAADKLRQLRNEKKRSGFRGTFRIVKKRMNPAPKNWVKADAVRVRRVGGKTIVEIRRKKKRNPPKRKAKKQASKRKATRQRKTKKKGRR